MVDQNVATLVADVAAVKSNVAGVAAVVAALLAKQSAAIDAEDLAAIVATHADLSTANAVLSGIANPPPATPAVSPAAAAAPAKA